MNSDLPKVLHRLGGKPLITHVLDTARALNPDRLLVIVGHRSEEVIKVLTNTDGEHVIQDPQLGTGHAVLQTRSALSAFVGDIVVLSGDVPLLKAATLRRLIEAHRLENASATVLSAHTDNPAGYGRIARNPDGQFERIVEEREASPEEKTIKEINSGVYCFQKNDLFCALNHVKTDNSKGEYYLTDVISILKKSDKIVQVYEFAEFQEVRGINTPAELAEAEDVLQSG